jgi:hypothetical protein
MKLVLASYFQPEFHGPGRKIGISPGKPNNLEYECDSVFEPFSPSATAYWDYQKNKKTDPEAAGKAFRDAYKEKLENTIAEAKKMAEDSGQELTDIFPFNHGDTLLSWEHQGHTTYRTMLAEYLREIGYEVEEK